MDLRALLQALGRRNETMTPELVSYLAFELASGLDFAHSSEGGIVHRDVSPSNVLLSRVGEIKLADFGIAKAISQPGVTRSGVVKGKVPYMAPEYARKGS